MKELHFTSLEACMQRILQDSRYLRRNCIEVVRLIYLPFVCIFLLLACKKEDPLVFIDNEIPDYEGIPTIVVQNYVNRMYIDLIGREPLDTEMDEQVAYLEENGLSMASRSSMADELMFSTEYISGDSSYNHAHFFRLYELAKARFIEGASEAILLEDYGIFYGNAMIDSLNGNISGYQLNIAQANRIMDVMDAREELRTEEISIDEMLRRMMYNSLYDEINMNSFNFVNASFDDLFFRFPTQSEFENAYQVIEFNEAAVIFGEIASNKLEYLNAMTSTGEFHEGMIYWAYQSLLSREPSSQEVFVLITNFQNTLNFQQVLKAVVTTDEYAGFD